MCLIEIALYYRERRLCRGRRSVTTAALALLTPSCTQKFKLVWWKADGNGVFWGKTSPEVTEVSTPYCTQGLTYSDPSAPGWNPVNYLCSWKPNRLFWDCMVPCCPPSQTSGCFYLSKKPKILQIQCNSNSENFTTAFCKQGGHRHFVTPAPFPCTAQTCAFCSQVPSHNPASLRDRMNWATSEWHRQGPRLYSHRLRGHNMYHAFSNQKWRTPNFHFQPPATMLCPALKENVNKLRKEG